MTPSNTSENALLHARDPETIRRLITNQNQKHTPHAFRAGHGGMADFNRLLPVLRDLPPAKLKQWMDLIDEMGESHRGCLPCSCKVLAYSFLITRSVLPGRSAHYKWFYEQAITRIPPPEGRDYLAEVIRSLQEAPGGPEERVHKINWQMTLEDLLAQQQQGG